ncbi:manganese-dependent inorganic pyrophosphatase [Jannaschia rubra]|uniref:manganese-dependent inorganic pyrophosphatase n=1 Tax=Jannaschia rubra TaxID=282197 RepID=UPI002492007C|nr:manganese-dependent inorganic pyrophosphatase [Jannaschia rubra]
MTTLVFGHKSPDTDSTGSAIAWAWYMNEVVGTEAEPALLGEPNTEAAWMLERWNLPKPRIIADLEEGQRCVVVDTNNPAELPDGIAEADLCQIIDHHRLVGGLETLGPIDITIRPLACTATIMADLMGQSLSSAPEGIRGAMLTCILSDTLEFRSPTTTDHDRALAERLASDLGVDIPEFAAEMFAAKSDVSAWSEEALLRMDSKEFDMEGTKLRVSVLETTSPAAILQRKDALVAAMPKVAEEDGVERVLLFVVDILAEEATLLVPDTLTQAVAEASFGVTVTGDTVVLPGVMSRKKQIIPVLTM